MHLALAIRNRGYTNEVHGGGLRENQRFLTHGGGFRLCSRDFQSPGARYKQSVTHRPKVLVRYS
ncbi:MAG: hypothetical protein HWQ23_13030 [Nostoc sp. JL33]|nr:hypothetical protein [Nostoc sp. JL33]